ncbi:cytoplasmic protein [Neobacillus vireti LMG 21834]|uniref:Cytoplasmic protein n=1 Tax=Neobacillus vireti LMG 21834 TaxID=1131730 RepID=A0AB94IUP5_9BACI|nr:cytoplasmic protein [Neobacillus vireti LMG 21834]
MKYNDSALIVEKLDVAPYMGAWIEIRCWRSGGQIDVVAPYMGAWIEIVSTVNTFRPGTVAPYMGAWIEIALRPSDT